MRTLPLVTLYPWLAVASRVALSIIVFGSMTRARTPKYQNVTALSPSQIAWYKPYSYYASAGYCEPSATLTWTCGPNCDANPTFVPFASGGDGDLTQWWFVGYDPSLQTVIVSHQGTNPEEILPLLIDSEILFRTLDPSLFPGITSPILVHSGFADAHARTAAEVLSAVKNTLARYNAGRVTIVGHSLGAAIGLLDAIYLPLHLPSNVNFTMVGYGLPRVGNRAFANHVDTHVVSFTHVNNKKDFIPILPGKFLGYAHPSGEVHIEREWFSCSGQDNPSKLCIVGAVPVMWEGNEADHDGPYDDVNMGC